MQRKLTSTAGRCARRSGELLRDGSTQRLPQQPLRVLVELLEHPGEVVTRERMVQLLWPKGVVDFDNSLNAVVHKLRVALKDDSETPRYIETLPRIGYRFIGTVTSAPCRTQAPAPELELPSSGLAAVVGVSRRARGFRLVASASRFTRSRAVDSAATARRSTNQRAYELYLDGKFHRSRRDVNGNPHAIENFQAALQEDPYFAEAWAALSETYTGTGTQQHMPLASAMEQARSTALRAIELDPKLAAGHSALGIVFMYYDFDYAGARRNSLDGARRGRSLRAHSGTAMVCCAAFKAERTKRSTTSDARVSSNP